MIDIDTYKQQGFGNSTGFGARPALLIVDLQVAFTDPQHLGGGNILAALNNTKSLLAVARQCGIPVAHSRNVFDAVDASVWCVKVKSLKDLTETAPASQIMEQVAPAPGECIVRKTKPSAFF